MRRLEREVSFEVSAAEEPLSLAESMGIFFDLHRKSSKDKAEFMTPKMQDYFRELSARFQERGWLKLSFLKVEGKEVATLFSFEFAGTKYVYNSGYDPQLGWISPGIVLAAHCIRRAIENGISVFNFLRGREEYKYHLGGREERIYRIRVVKA
jgi:CelD/BcsL family acetyltransferase involved in cellulose biosynthesis